MQQQQAEKTRFSRWWWVLAGVAVLAVPVGIVVSIFADWSRDVPAIVPQRVEQTVLVEDDTGFCLDFTAPNLSMAQRISTPSLYSRIMPANVPEEHFAEDAGRIVKLISVGQFGRAYELADEYDAAVQARCNKGAN